MGWRSWAKNTRHNDQTLKVDKFQDKLDTVIGNDVWIGQGAFIKTGANIGTGAIVAAGAIFVSDVEPYTIVGGVPAKPIRKRFKDDLVDRFLSSKWWNYVITDFGFDISDPEAAISQIEDQIENMKLFEPQIITAIDIVDILLRGN